MKLLFKTTIFTLLCFALLSLSGLQEASAGDYETGIYVINTMETPLNVRSGPSTDSPRVGEVPKDACVDVLFVSSNDWGRIDYNDIHGWISLEYCLFEGPSSQTAAVCDCIIEDEQPEVKECAYGISSINLSWVEGCDQKSSKTTGLCTSSATGTLLRRRQAAEGKEVTFTFSDVRTSLGGSGIPNSMGKYSDLIFDYTPAGGWVHEDALTGEQTVYYTAREDNYSLVHNTDHIADLMDRHPEGIVIYVQYGYDGRHAIVLSDYVRHKNGVISFFAYDPADHGVRSRLEDTWLMTKFDSVRGLINNIIMLWYIDGDLTVDDSKFDFPKARAVNRIGFVKNDMTSLRADASNQSEIKRIVGAGEILNISYVYVNKDCEKWYITDEGYFISDERIRIK